MTRLSLDAWAVIVCLMAAGSCGGSGTQKPAIPEDVVTRVDGAWVDSEYTEPAILEADLVSDVEDGVAGEQISLDVLKDSDYLDLLQGADHLDLPDSLEPDWQVAWELSRRFTESCGISNGSVFCWGYAPHGELGNGKYGIARYPVQVDGVSDAVALADGGNHVCSLSIDGSVACWGSNAQMQLGVPGVEASSIPVEVSGLPMLSDICAGVGYICGLDSSGAVWCWGSGEAVGEVVEGGNSNEPFKIPDLPQMVQLACGAKSVCALEAGGPVWCWGGNDFGQAAPTDPLPIVEPAPVTEAGLPERVSSDWYSVCAWELGQSPICWGKNLWFSGEKQTLPQTVDAFEGSLDVRGNCALMPGGLFGCLEMVGDDATAKEFVPVDVGEPIAAVVGSDAIVSASGQFMRRNSYTGTGDFLSIWEAVPVLLPEAAIDVATGDDFMLVVLASGKVMIWGDPFFGNSGYPVDIALASYVEDLAAFDVVDVCAGSSYYWEGERFSCVLTGDGTVLCAGGNGAGQLGNGTKEASTSFSQVVLPAPATALDCGERQVCALHGGESVSCWGANSGGTVMPYAGFSTYPLPTTWNLPESSHGIRVSGDVACALADSGALYCWGDSFPGCGLDAGEESGPELCPVPGTIIDFDVGDENNLCVLNDLSGVWCMGGNSWGQVAPGNEDVWQTSLQVVNTGVSGEITRVFCGDRSTCVTPDAGGAVCWGSTDNGLLGTGGPNALDPIASPSFGGQVAGLSEQLATVSPSSQHTCALTDSGHVYCWGVNYLSQCGWPGYVADFVPVAIPPSD
jgi:alpha-tubulin suppressor-like RCC1 family protein